MKYWLKRNYSDGMVIALSSHWQTVLELEYPVSESSHRPNLQVTCFPSFNTISVSSGYQPSSPSLDSVTINLPCRLMLLQLPINAAPVKVSTWDFSKSFLSSLSREGDSQQLVGVSQTFMNTLSSVLAYARESVLVRISEIP